ncbi:MAG: hypothetical protein VX681_04865 [Myxococcota bacterium]|nr:hypothetical protein [Myxococcota bacterium]
MDVVVELGTLLVAGLIASIGLALVLALSSNKSLTRHMLPAEVSAMARTALPGGSILDGEYDSRLGFLLIVADGFGTRLQLRVLRDATAAWLFDTSIAWQEIESFQMDERPALEGWGAHPKLPDPALSEQVAGAWRAKGLAQQDTGDASGLVRCALCPAERPLNRASLVIELVERGERSLAWRALASPEEGLDPQGAVEHVGELMDFYPPAAGPPEKTGA